MRITLAVCMQMSIRLPIKSWQLRTISKIHSEQSRRKRAKLSSIRDVLRSSPLRDISCPALSYIYIYVYIYMYIYVYIYMYIYVYIYVYIYFVTFLIHFGASYEINLELIPSTVLYSAQPN